MRSSIKNKILDLEGKLRIKLFFSEIISMG